jgi:hypothetical protein
LWLTRQMRSSQDGARVPGPVDERRTCEALARLQDAIAYLIEHSPTTQAATSLRAVQESLGGRRGNSPPASANATAVSHFHAASVSVHELYQSGSVPVETLLDCWLCLREVERQWKLGGSHTRRSTAVAALDNEAGTAVG